MSLTETRTDLYDTLVAALTDDRVRVAKYPIRPGTLTRYDALVTIGNMGISTERAGMVTVELEVQVGIGDIETTYELVDQVLDDVDDALPIQFEAADWVVTAEQDDQPVIRAYADLLGHPSDEPAPPAVGDLALINDAGDFAIINDAGDFAEIN